MRTYVRTGVKRPALYPCALLLWRVGVPAGRGVPAGAGDLRRVAASVELLRDRHRPRVAGAGPGGEQQQQARANDPRGTLIHPARMRRTGIPRSPSRWRLRASWRHAGLLIGAVLVAGVVLFALSHLHLHRIGHALVSASPGWVTLALVLMA